MDSNNWNYNTDNNTNNSANYNNANYNNNTNYNNTNNTTDSANINYGYGMNYSTNTAASNISSPVIEESHRGRGVIGALLGALVGGVLWTLIGCAGYVSGWIAALIFVLAQWGYKKFAGKEDAFGVIISVVFGLIVILPATWIANGYYVFEELSKRGNFTFLEVLADLPMYMERYELWGQFGQNLAIGYLFTIVMAIAVFAGRLKKR